MVYRGSRPREPKSSAVLRVSTPEEKYRRHKNKLRIWRRAVKRLALEQVAAT